MDLAQFAALSQVLTAYGPDVILPKNNTQNMAQDYLDVLNRPDLVSPEVIQLLTQKWTSIATQPQQQWEQLVQSNIMNNTQLAPVAQNIIYMWYLGIWYDLTTAGNDFVVSSKAYRNGLVWGTIGAHPMGFSEEVFGYWNTPAVIPPINTNPSA